MVVFALTGVASITSGAALAAVGWKRMQWAGWGCAVAMAGSVALAKVLDCVAASDKGEVEAESAGEGNTV